MKTNEYLVWFGHVFIQVFAFSPLDAAIIATAERIRDGKFSEIRLIEDVDNPKDSLFFDPPTSLVFGK